jgi:hypothetical protein
MSMVSIVMAPPCANHPLHIEKNRRRCRQRFDRTWALRLRIGGDFVTIR